MNWLKVSIHHPPDAAEALSALLFAEGAQGVWEDLPDAQGRVVTRSGFEPARREDLERLLPELVERARAAFDLAPGDFEWRLEMEENHDWAEKWKEGLEPISVGPALAIAPTFWPEESLPEAARVLRLDPGLAFGSGHHATTFLCLYLLAELAPEAARILDVGAGSGILTLAAAALNPQALTVGVDNDPETIEVARENAALNNLAGASFSGAALSDLSGKFDLIVANITLNPLLELAPLISERASDNAKLILSGLLDSQAEEAASEYEKRGWKLSRRLNRDEWTGLLFARAL